MASAVAFESAVVLVLRLALFFSSQKYLLLRYHDSPARNDVELQTLPPPSTAALKPSHAPSQRPFHLTLSRAIFSLCFAECCTLFVLLMFQALDILHPRSRLLNWRVSLAFLLALIVVVIPLAYSLILSSSGLQRPTPTRLILTALPIGLFLFLLSFVPLPAAVPATTNPIVARLTVAGTVILGLLSGFGAVNNAWRFFPILSRNTDQPAAAADDAQISRAEDGLRRIQADLAQRRTTVASQASTSPSRTRSPWFFVPLFGRHPAAAVDSAEEENGPLRRVPPPAADAETAQELAGLEALEAHMAHHLAGLRQRHADARFARTLRGRVFHLGGRVFAAYCVYRIFIAIVNLVLPSQSKSESSPTHTTDVITALLAALLPPPHDRIASISRQISLALVGLIILSSLRLVLRGVTKAVRVSGRHLGTSLMLLMMAQLMGIYLLSTLVQLRTSFPPPSPSSNNDNDIDIDGKGTAPAVVVNLFTTLPEYHVFGAVFDGAFVLAAGATALVRWVGQRIGDVDG